MYSSAISLLPVELLSRVFVLALQPDNPGSPFPLTAAQDPFPAPFPNTNLFLSHVSRRWRAVALRTPPLWSLIHFREPTHMARAQVFLKRALRSPHQTLDILVETVAVSDHVDGLTLCRAEFHPVFDIITPHVARWRSFSLKIRDNECKAGARARLSSCGPAPALETLQLFHFEDFGCAQNLYLATVRPPVMIFDGVLPAIKNVSLIGVNLPWAHTPFLRSLSTVQLALHSEGVRPEWHHWSEMLSTSPALENLALHYSGPRSIPPKHLRGPPILLSALADLSLTDLDPDQLCALFDTMIIPNLRRLTLDLPEQDFTAFVSLLASPVQVSGSSGDDGEDGDGTDDVPPHTSLAHLEQLTITSLDCTLKAWRALLVAVPVLSVLDANFNRLPDGAFDVMCEDLSSVVASSSSSATSPSAYLSSLHTLTLSGISGAQLEALIAHRDRAGCRPAKWVVKGVKDGVIDRLMEQGWVGESGRKVKIEWVGVEEEESDGEDDEDDQGEGEDDEQEEEEGINDDDDDDEVDSAGQSDNHPPSAVANDEEIEEGTISIPADSPAHAHAMDSGGSGPESTDCEFDNEDEDPGDEEEEEDS